MYSGYVNFLAIFPKSRYLYWIFLPRNCDNWVSSK